MAPHSSGSVIHVPLIAPLNALITEQLFVRRSLENDENVTTTNIFTAAQQHILILLAMLFASISVASSSLAFYWFVRMRRSFRHDLIMLLIQSDMFKALWFMSYPLVVIINGPVRSESVFCQISGFFLTVGIEQSDVAVLIIAVHSALFIFKNKPFGKEEGLYPYRHMAYTVWVLFPLTMASLAFLGGRNTYVVEGTFCYLRARPFWYQLALDWIPRYFIFIIILGTYGSIYYYVRKKFHGFTRDDNGIPRSSLIYPFSHPPTPPLASHGLIPDSGATLRNETEEYSSIKKSPHQQKTTRSYAAQFMMEASCTRGLADGSSTVPAALRSPLDRHTCAGPPLSATLQSPRHFSSNQIGLNRNHPHLHSHDDDDDDDEATLAVSEISTDQQVTPWLDLYVRRHSSTSIRHETQQPSTPAVMTHLTSNSEIQQIQTPASLFQIRNSLGHITTRAEMIVTRDRIRRQLRFLFIYPLVYIGMWILPFITHTMQYKDLYAANPPFVLRCATTVSICIQAFVDCWLFSTREKPWRHIPGSDGSFGGSLKFWTGWNRVGDMRTHTTGPGRTRDEMVREARAAYQRRDDELAQRRSQLDATGFKSDQSNSQRSWWDFDRTTGRFDIMHAVEEEGDVND